MSADNIAPLAQRPIVEQLVDEFDVAPERINIDTIVMLYRAAEREGDEFLWHRERLNEIIDAISDDRRKAIAIEFAQLREEAYRQHVAVYDWGFSLAESSFERTLKARRAESGQKKIAIADPHLQIELEAQYGYDADAYALELIAKDLPDDDAAKLVKVIEAYTEPEHTVVVPAREVPRQVIAGNTTSILAVAKKYAGTPIAAAIDAAMGRKLIKETFFFRPHPKKAPKPVEPVSQ